MRKKTSEGEDGFGEFQNEKDNGNKIRAKGDKITEILHRRKLKECIVIYYFYNVNTLEITQRLPKTRTVSKRM